MFGARKANLSCSRVFQFGEIRKCRMILDGADAFQTKLMSNTEHTNTRTLSHIIKKRTLFAVIFSEVIFFHVRSVDFCTCPEIIQFFHEA